MDAAGSRNTFKDLAERGVACVHGESGSDDSQEEDFGSGVAALDKEDYDHEG